MQGITLGFTNLTDLIYAYNYKPNGYTFKIADGQTLVDDYGRPYSGTLQMQGPRYGCEQQTLRPVTGVTLTKDNPYGNEVSATFDGTSTTTVSIPVDVEVTSVTYNRTFTADKPATVMLPFDYTCNGSEGGTFYSFIGVEEENGQWIATMRDTEDPVNKVTTLTANTPYLVMPSVTSLTFTGGATLNTTGGGSKESTSGDWTFHGTYTYLTYGNDPFNGTVFGFAATDGKATDNSDVTAGQFVKAADGAFIQPFRAYLTYSGSNTALQALARGENSISEIPDRINVRLLGSDDSLTAVGTIDLSTGDVTIERWFDINGRAVEGIPSAPGMYLNNSGKKVMIK